MIHTFSSVRHWFLHKCVNHVTYLYSSVTFLQGNANKFAVKDL
jgi:hypothetical protein